VRLRVYYSHSHVIHDTWSHALGGEGSALKCIHLGIAVDVTDNGATYDIYTKLWKYIIII
jgi:hypothetical protein